MDRTHDDFVFYFTSPRLKMHFRGRERSVFAHASEKWHEWTMLACEVGTFRFGVGDGNGKRDGVKISGIASPLDWVLCPPDVVLEREVLSERLTFHVVRFDWDVDASACPIVGLNRPHDASRSRANFDAWTRSGARDDPLANAWREHILCDLLRAATWSAALPVVRAEDALMERARAALDDRVAEHISMADLSRALKLSPASLTRRFHACHGVVPSEYLARQRLDRARQLLLDTDWTLDRIAVACGMTNAFYFSRVWSRRFGQSPGQFRRARRV